MHRFSINGSIISDDDAWIYRLFGISHASPALVAAELATAAGDEVEITLNSGGGSVFAGSEIRELLRGYEGKVTIKITGIAASAASVIATAADCEIAPTGMVMIHNASSSARGDYRDMDHASQMLVKVNTAIANAYIEKTGMSQKDLFSLMDAETYMTAQEAVEKGFVDRITPSKQADTGSHIEFINDVMHIDTEKVTETILGMITDVQEGKTDAIPKELMARLQMASKNQKQDNAKQDTQLSASTEQDSCVIDKNQKEDTLVTIEELREQHPELGAQLDAMVLAARQEGIAGERQRMQEIDAMARSIPADLVHNAKYEKPVSAGELAMTFLAQGQIAAENYMNHAKEDAEDSGSKDVPSNPSDSDENQEEAALYSLMVDAANEGMEVSSNDTKSNQ